GGIRANNRVAARRRRSAHLERVRLAKRRIGEAAISEKGRVSFSSICARRLPQSLERMRNRHTANSDEGFTLIELVIVTAVLPIIVGALAVGMLSIFSLNSSVTNRLSDSGDAQQVSLYMQNDIQSASKIT